MNGYDSAASAWRQIVGSPFNSLAEAAKMRDSAPFDEEFTHASRRK
jgi:hypothetical protein